MNILSNKETENLVLSVLLDPNPGLDLESFIPTKEERHAIWENWRKKLSIEEVFAPVKDEDKRNKCIELFNELRKNEGNTQQVATA